MQGSERVPEAMERDVLRYSCRFQPVPQVFAVVGCRTQSSEYPAFRLLLLSEEAERLFGYRHRFDAFGLFLLKINGVAFRLVLPDLAPSQFFNVRETQSGQSGEEGGTFQQIILARRFSQFIQFFRGEVFPARFGRFYGIHTRIQIGL